MVSSSSFQFINFHKKFNRLVIRLLWQIGYWQLTHHHMNMNLFYLWMEFINTRYSCHEMCKNEFRMVPTKDTCSWKGRSARTRSWKVLSSKVWSWKVSLKLERAKQSWKEPIEVGKFEQKLESSGWSWKVQLKLESLNWTWKYLMKLKSYYWSSLNNWTWKDL